MIVQGVGFIKKHTRPNPQRNIKGGIAEREAAIHASQRDDRVRASATSAPASAHKLLADGKKVAHLPRARVLDSAPTRCWTSGEAKER